MKARDIIFYIRALTAIILAEHFRLGSTMEKISDNFIPYLLSIITTVLLKLQFYFAGAILSLCERLSTNYYYY